jgi:hypothetical protein
VRLHSFLKAVLGGLLFVLCAHCHAGQVIPFEYRDGLIWVKVNIAASEEPLNFVLDSGAGSSVVSLETVRKLGIKRGASAKVRRVGANASAFRVSGFLADVAGVPISQTPLAIDLADTSQECSRAIDGLLGHDFFLGRIVQIDFKSRCIRLLDKAADRNCCAILSLRLTNAAMCVPVSVNGSKLKWTRLDTGCDDGLHWVAGTGNQYVRTSLQLGSERITNVKTALHNSEIFPGEAGLLGNGVLSDYRVTIDAVTHRLLLEKS